MNCPLLFYNYFNQLLIYKKLNIKNNMFKDRLVRGLREEEFKSLLMANVGYTTNKMNCSIIPFVVAIKSMNEELKDVLKRMKGWKKNNELHTSPSGETKTKAEWFNDIKKDLPAFTLTSYAPLTRNAKEILNPYIIVDIDGIEVDDDLFNILNSLPFVLGSGISTSGEGVWSVVKFDKKAVTNEEDFKALFQALYEEYDYDFDIKIDTSCSNINRLRYISPYDFELNDNYEEPFTFTKNIKRPNSFTQHTTTNSFTFTNSGDSTTLNVPIQSTGKCEIPESYQYRGEECEDYYRTYEYLPYIDENNGRNYQLLYKYANAIYRCCGEEGWNIYCNYFPTTKSIILKGYWSTARRYKKDISDFIVQELRKLGLCEIDFDF